MGIPADDVVVFVPAHPAAHASAHRQAKDVAFETRPLPDGRRLGIAFTSVETLATTLGAYQPWVALPVENLREFLGTQGVRLVMFDPPVPDEGWRWTPARLDAVAEVQ